MKSINYRGIVFYEPDYEDESHNRSRTNYAILCGRIKHKPCEICGHEISNAHHEKYADFLNVRWLCHVDHKIIHSIFKSIKYSDSSLAYYRNELIKYPDSDNTKWHIKKIEEKLKLYDVRNI